MKTEKAESKIQQEIIMMVRSEFQKMVIFSVPNEGKNPKEQMAKIATGLMSGVADLILLTPDGNTTFIEVKTPTGTQSPKQIKFEKKVIELGFEYYVVRDVESVRNICADIGLEIYLAT